MEQNIADFLKDAFPETDFEQLHFDDDTATEADVDVPQNEPDKKDKHNQPESSGSESDFELTNREGETKYYSENNVNFSEEQNTKTGSALCGSWDDNDTGENKTQSQNQKLSLPDEECGDDEFEIHTDILQQPEEVSELETVLPAGASHDEETLRTSLETTSHLLSLQMLDEPENGSSTSEEDRTESENSDEHSLDDNKLDRFSTIQSASQDWPVESENIQPEGEMKEFTEEDDEDPEREEEGLADYPSDLSQTDSGDSSEGHEAEEPNHMDTQLVACSYEDPEEAPLSYKCVTSIEDEAVDHLDVITYENLNVDTTSGRSDDDDLFQMKQDSNSENPITGESSDFGISKNLSSIPAGTKLPENRHSSESHPSEDCSTKPEHNSELDVSDQNILTLLPETFWSVTDKDNLNFDEYDWDINEKDKICDEEDDFLEEPENDGEENERDWEKEKARIEAFNRYYELAEGEKNTAGRSHKVTFSLEPEMYLHYEEDSESSDEDPETSSFEDQNYDYEISEFPQISFTAEDIGASLMGDDNLEVEEYNYENNRDELYKVSTSKVCDEDDFLEKLKMEIEQELEKDRIKNMQESKKEQNEVTNRTNKALFQLHQEFSQNEDDNDSSEQESNTEDDTAKAPKTEDQSDSDEFCERRLYTGRHKFLGLRRAEKQKKETPPRNKCVVLLRSVLAVSLGAAVGLLSYCWATDSLDWTN